MKKLMIFGDSIIKGVTYSGQSYHLCQDHDFDTIAAQGVTVENYARMGATIDAGLKQIDRRLAPCAEDTTIRKARQAGARVAMTSLPPLEQSRYFSFITKGLSAENILRWLGDTDHLYRWQEYYNDMVTQLSRAFGCRLVDLRAEFLKSRVFPSLIGADGIHPTQAGHDLIHQSVQTALSY